MKRVKVRALVLGVSLVVLGSYVAVNLILNHTHRLSPNQQLHISDSASGTSLDTLSGSSSLAIIANTPTPTSVYKRISNPEIGVNTGNLAAAPAVQNDSEDVTVGVNGDSVNGELPAHYAEMAGDEGTGAGTAGAITEATVLLLPTSTATFAALPASDGEAQAVQLADAGDTAIVRLPTATPTADAVAMAPEQFSTAMSTATPALAALASPADAGTNVSPIIPPPTPVADQSRSYEQTGVIDQGPSSEPVVQEPITDVQIASGQLPTATPAVAASQALAAEVPPASAVQIDDDAVPATNPDVVTADQNAALAAPNQAASVDGCSISTPPGSLGLDPFYSKYCAAFGLPIIASAEVPDQALQHAWRTVVRMLDGIAQAEDVQSAMISMATRIAIISVRQVPTDMPEYRDLYTLFPDVDWNNRTRGIGATHQIPLLAIGEENVLCYADDKWIGQNLLVHEFAHAIKNMGIDVVNPGFHADLERVYHSALDTGLWAGTYAASNVEEYWAEGVRLYFRLEGEPNAPGGQVYPANNRTELQRYDPQLYQIIENTFGPREAIVRCS